MFFHACCSAEGYVFDWFLAKTSKTEAEMEDRFDDLDLEAGDTLHVLDLRENNELIATLTFLKNLMSACDEADSIIGMHDSLMQIISRVMQVGFKLGRAEGIPRKID